MLKIRFQRIGRKKNPFFRIVVAEHSKPVQGRFLEILGHFNPQTKETVLNEERIVHWIANGAQMSDRVARLAVKNDIKECERFIKERIMKPTKAEQKAEEDQKKEKEEKAKSEQAPKPPAVENITEKKAEVKEQQAEQEAIKEDQKQTETENKEAEKPKDEDLEKVDSSADKKEEE